MERRKPSQPKIVVSQEESSPPRRLYQMREGSESPERFSQFSPARPKHSRTKSHPTKSTAAPTPAEKSLTAQHVDSQMVDATYLLQELLEEDKLRRRMAKKSNEVTVNMDDAEDGDLLPDVHQRRWTLVSSKNPIWRFYCTRLRIWLGRRQKDHLELGACSHCLTIFYPGFPHDFHMHERSASFATAVDQRRVNTVDRAAEEAAKENLRLEAAIHKALVGLAKEAGAHKYIKRGECIKLVRFASGKRLHRGKSKYERMELCENCQVDVDIRGEAQKKYRVAGLADGIIQLINM